MLLAEIESLNVLVGERVRHRIDGRTGVITNVQMVNGHLIRLVVCWEYYLTKQPILAHNVDFYGPETLVFIEPEDNNADAE
jgi:hypothetical protein